MPQVKVVSLLWYLTVVEVDGVQVSWVVLTYSGESNREEQPLRIAGSRACFVCHQNYHSIVMGMEPMEIPETLQRFGFGASDRSARQCRYLSIRFPAYFYS